ncbi:MAG: HEAT repeat domain-containing protein [Terriglobales bacterium]
MYYLLQFLLLLPFVIAHLYVALCLRAVGNKILGSTSWKPWLPVANILYLCQLAQKPAWWILLTLVPILDVFIFILLWVGVARRVGKPAWMGVLVSFFPCPLAGLLTRINLWISVASTIVLAASVMAIPWEREGLQFYKAVRQLRSPEQVTRQQGGETLMRIVPLAGPLPWWYREDLMLDGLTEAVRQAGKESQREPALSASYRDPAEEEIERHFLHLSDIGPPATPSLMELMASQLPYIRGQSALALGMVLSREHYYWRQDNPRSAAGLSSGSVRARKQQLERGLPAMVLMLKDRSPYVRGMAAQGLGILGPDAKSVVPALRELLNDPDPGVRQQVAFWLRSIGYE